MSDLDEQGQRLLLFLVNQLKNVEPGNLGTYIGYRRVHTMLELDLRGGTWGRSLKHQGLSSLADWTAAQGKPAITGVIIDTVKGTPGSGYFDLFNKAEDDFTWWKEQVRLSKEYDWSPYLLYSALPQLPNASDIDGPVEREEVTIYRILRDTNVSRRVKALHRYKCQLCGYTMTLPDGSYYAEAHHIRPLGKPHNGPDAMDNILCLCPNHHAEMDYGVRKLESKDLAAVTGHSVNADHVGYHNGNIFKSKS
jgi:hypothetical protein